MPRMEKEIGKVSDDLWIYPLHREDRTLGVAAVTLMLLLFLLFVTLGASQETLFVWAILTILQLPYIFLKRVIEIDRKRGVVKKWWQIFNFRNDKFYQLNDFSELRVSKRVISRYGTIPEYVIALLGPSSSLKVLVTRSRDKAKQYSLELAEFLGVKLLDTTR